MVELNVHVTGPDGQAVPGAIIECVVLDKNLAPCPFEPKIKQQPNFYSGASSFSDAMGPAHPGPYFVYGTAQAAGYGPGYFPKDGGFGVPWDGAATLNIPVTLPSFKQPFKAAPRFWKANFCGIRIPGLPPVAGGAPDASLFLSWFYDRYDTETRTTIRAAMKGRGYTHWLLSWPDSRSVGATPQSFVALCRELIADGFYPCVFLSSKDFDPPNVADIFEGIVPLLNLGVGVIPMWCVGWELSLWLTPSQVQELIDAIAPPCLAQSGTLVYVHFQQGYPSFQQEGGTVADFWVKQVGKLTGLLYQKIIEQNDAEFLDSINDCLQRFAGGFNMPTGFDFVGLELSAMTQYAGTCSEAEGDRIGRLAINAPKVNGVGVMGSGNGC